MVEEGVGYKIAPSHNGKGLLLTGFKPLTHTPELLRVT